VLVRKFRYLIPGVLAVVLAGVAAIAVYTIYMAKQIDARFSSHRWNIPSTVYSDTTLLFPGQFLNLELFKKKINRLGYRRVSHPPLQKGEMRISPDRIEIYLHDFKASFFDAKGYPVSINLDRNRILSLTRTENGRDLPLVELEPEELMMFFGKARERRLVVPLKEVPVHLVHAVLAAEDNRFYSHHGVDFRGITRALWTNLRKLAILQGGSTLTQQLAKNYFLTPERTLKRKFNELFIALILEFSYEKDEILEIYLNEIYWGQKGSVSINGVGEAARFYFDKPVTDLTVPESATLAALIKAPNHYSPYVDITRCLKRRNDVLEKMYDNGWIDENTLRNALPQPVKPAGYSGYNRQAPYFIDYVARQLADLYPPDILSSLGLSMHTTLDTQVQEAAEIALEKGLLSLESANPRLKRDDPDKKLQGAVIVMQPKTGYILAMVGGRSYNASQFNRATQAKRQPGSAFKPFVYLKGLDRFTPVSRLDNTPRDFTVDGRAWRPKNFSNHAPATVSFRDALAGSQNVATVQIAMETGLSKIVQTGSEFNFSTALAPYPSMALGAFEVIPLELARAYCVFAADGFQPFPLSLKEVESESGQILQQRHATIRRLIGPDKAYMINDLLKSVVEKGTAGSLKHRGIHWPVAGKTGTTNDSKDAWFIGYTPDILALVWVGFDDGDSLNATGAKAALPIWADLMKAIPQYTSGEWFQTPSGVVRRTVCAESGKIAVFGRCPHPVVEVFLERQVPMTQCPIHPRLNFFEEIWKGIINFDPLHP